MITLDLLEDLEDLYMSADDLHGARIDPYCEQSRFYINDVLQWHDNDKIKLAKQINLHKTILEAQRSNVPYMTLFLDRRRDHLWWRREFDNLIYETRAKMKKDGVI